MRKVLWKILVPLVFINILWWRWFYISEQEARQIMNLTLPSEVEYIGSQITARMVYFSVPPDMVDDLAETFENTFGYHEPPYRGKEKVGELKSKLTGEIMQSYYFGQLNVRPSHFCILTQDGEAHYLWYLQE